MKLAGVMVVRDEEAILGTNLAYHRSLGVDEFWIIDNGSTDSTRDILAAQADRFGDVRWRSEPGPFRQSEATTALVLSAVDDGYEWVLPIDADEFWWSRNGSLRDVLVDSKGIGAFVCGVDNFVQHRSVAEDNSTALLTMKYRAESVGTMENARELVESDQIGFVEIVYPPKHVVRASTESLIGIGNHTVSNVKGDVKPNPNIRVLHAPIPSLSTLRRKAEYGRRWEVPSPTSNSGWHVRRWANLENEGNLEKDWLANSQRFGWSRVGSSFRRMKRDLRLRHAVAPFVQLDVQPSSPALADPRRFGPTAPAPR